MKFLKQLREQDFRGSGKYNSSNAPDFRGGRKSRQDHNNEAYPNKYPENRQWSRHDDPRARAVDMINQAVEDNEDRFELIGDPDSLIKYLKGKHHDFSPDLEVTKSLITAKSRKKRILCGDTKIKTYGLVLH
jgi:hypothetical protein